MKKYNVSVSCEVINKSDVISVDDGDNMYDTFAVTDLFAVAKETGICVEDILTIDIYDETVEDEYAIKGYVKVLKALCNVHKDISNIRVSNKKIIEALDSSKDFEIVTDCIGGYEEREVFILNNDCNKSILEEIKSYKKKKSEVTNAAE